MSRSSSRTAAGEAREGGVGGELVEPLLRLGGQHAGGVAAIVLPVSARSMRRNRSWARSSLLQPRFMATSRSGSSGSGRWDITVNVWTAFMGGT